MKEKITSRLDEDTLRKLTATIIQCVDVGMDDSQICRTLNITEEQLEHIRENPLYQNSVHELIHNDADTARMLCRAANVEVTQILIDKAKNGDMDAIKQFHKIIGADRPQKDIAQQSEIQLYLNFLKAIGINQSVVTDAEKIKASKELKLIESKINDKPEEDIEEDIIVEYEIENDGPDDMKNDEAPKNKEGG